MMSSRERWRSRPDQRPRARRSRRRHLFVFLILTSITGLIVAACGAPDPNLSRGGNAGAKPGGHILFAQGGDIALWDGNSTKKLTDLGNASSPSWSNDGQQFAFIRSGDGFSDLWVANADGSNQRQLTYNQPPGQIGTEAYACNAVWALDPVWSPVGDTIAFSSDLGTTCDYGVRPNFLWIMRGLGNNPTRVPASTTNNDNVEQPAFSPNGTQVVFAQRTNVEGSLERTTQLWKINLNTGQLSQVIQANQGTYDPAWSPDGKWIAFIERTGTANDLWVIPAGGGNAVQLTTSGNVTSPVWSPDGSAIAFFVTDGLGFKAQYLSFSVGPDGAPKADGPHDLFTADDIDAVSGMSWRP